MNSLVDHKVYISTEHADKVITFVRFLSIVDHLMVRPNTQKLCHIQTCMVSLYYEFSQEQ